MDGHLQVEVLILPHKKSIYPAYVKDVEENGLLVSFTNDWMPPISIPFNAMQLPPKEGESTDVSVNQNVEVRVNIPGIQGAYFWRRGRIKFIERFISGGCVISFPSSRVYEVFPSSSVRTINKNSEINAHTFKKIEIEVPECLCEIAKGIGIHEKFAKKLKAEVCFYVTEIQSLRIICKGENFTLVSKNLEACQSVYFEILLDLRRNIFIRNDENETFNDFDLISFSDSSSETNDNVDSNNSTFEIISNRTRNSESSSLNPSMNSTESSAAEIKNSLLLFEKMSISNGKTSNSEETNQCEQLSKSSVIMNTSPVVNGDEITRSTNRYTLSLTREKQYSNNDQSLVENDSFDEPPFLAREEENSARSNSLMDSSSIHSSGSSTICNTDYCEEFAISKNLIGLALGKQRRNLRAARNLPDIKRINLNEKTRCFQIIGLTKEAVKAARRKIEFCQIDIMIGEEYAEFLLKDNMKVLKEIEEKTGLHQSFVKGRANYFQNNSFIFTLMGLKECVFDTKAYLEYESYVLKKRNAASK